MGYIKEVRKKTLPEEKRGEAKIDFVTYYIIRGIADLLTVPLVKLKVNATTVTKFSLIWVILMFVFFMIDGNQYAILGLLCFFIWDILDGIDGNIARYTNTCSSNGGLWDASVGWLATFGFFLGMGILAFRENALISLKMIPQYYYIIFGAIAGFALIFPRLVMHKKKGLEREANIEELKDRKNYSILKKIVFNLDSINGLGFIIFVLCFWFKLTNLCTLGYLFLNGAIAVGMCYKLLK